MNEIIKKRYEKLGPTMVKSLEDKGFEAYYCSTAQGAVGKILELIPSGSTVGWGGSLTLEEIGIKDKLKEKGFTVYDRDTAATKEERFELMFKSHLSDFFLMSSNAVSEDGCLLNIDGFGNRIASLIYGPKSVIVICGLNKVVKTPEDAYSHVRTIVAPANAQRVPGEGKPCRATGICSDCNNPDTICNQILITRRCSPAKRIKVILVGEDLGI